MLTQTTYYANEWMDEMPGVCGDLLTVAKQLAEGVTLGDDDWEVEPQPIPSSHAGQLVQYTYVPCERLDDGAYRIPADLPGEIHAIAIFEDGGWTSAMMPEDRAEAQAMLNEDGSEPVEYLVCRTDHADGTIHLSEGPTATFERTV